jgi:hypothetical protein
MTSAPIATSHAVAHGPDQKAVKSSTLTPARGRCSSDALPSARDDGRAGAGGGGESPECSPSRGAAVICRSGTAENRNGARGRIQDSPG